MQRTQRFSLIVRCFRSSVAVRNYEKRWVTLCASNFVRRENFRAKGKIVHYFVKSAQPNLQEREAVTSG